MLMIVLEVPIVVRRPLSDTTLTVGSLPESIQVHKVPASTRTFLFTPGLHYNPVYWDDPEEFVPARFINTNWNRDAFIPFSLGPWVCIGRRWVVNSLRLFTVLSRCIFKGLRRLWSLRRFWNCSRNILCLSMRRDSNQFPVNQCSIADNVS